MHVSADPDVPVVRAHRRASHDGHDGDCAGEVDGRFIAKRGRVACRIAVALAGVAQAVGTCAFVTPGLTERGALDARGLAGGRLLGTRAVGRVAGPQMVRGAQIPSTGAEGHGRRNVWPKTVRKWKPTAAEKDVQTADAWEGTRAQTQRGSAPRVSTQRVSAPRVSTQRESTPGESSVSTQESYIKRWGASAKGIPSASLPTQPRYDDEEPSSIPFRGGWAETYSVAWDMAGGDAIPTRIPFLFGTGRGAAPSVAIMAPAESTSLYKRIPFLAGSQRQQEKEEAQLVVGKEGMGEEASAGEETELKAARERSRFAIAEYRQYLRELEQARSAEKEKAQASASAGPAMPAESAGFDAETLCSDLDLDNEARVFKVGKKDQASFAWFGDAGAATGVAEWTVRVERQSGVMFIGVALEPRVPILGFARNLQTPAWMIGSYGCVGLAPLSLSLSLSSLSLSLPPPRRPCH